MEWTEASVRAVLEQMSGRFDPNDPKERTRKRIIAAASELFIEHGYKKATVDEIAARAGVSKVTLYAYAKNKASLLALALVEEKLGNLEELLPVLDESRPGRDRLKDIVRTWLMMGEKWPLTTRILEQDRDFLFALDTLDDRFKVPDQDNRLELYEVIIEAAAPGHYTAEERGERAKAFFSICMASLTLRDPFARQGLRPERLADLIADMVVDGLLPRA